MSWLSGRIELDIKPLDEGILCVYVGTAGIVWQNDLDIRVVRFYYQMHSCWRQKEIETRPRITTIMFETKSFRISVVAAAGPNGMFVVGA